MRSAGKQRASVAFALEYGAAKGRAHLLMNGSNTLRLELLLSESSPSRRLCRSRSSI